MLNKFKSRFIPKKGSETKPTNKLSESELYKSKIKVKSVQNGV